MNRYHDLELELYDHAKVGTRETLRSRVLSSPAGAQRDHEAIEVEFPAGLRADLARLESRTIPVDELITLGQKLGNLLLPPAARDLFRRSLERLAEDEGLRIRLRADSPELAELPWEYAYVVRPGSQEVHLGPEGFLTLDRRISLGRYEVLGEAPTALKPLRRGEIQVVALLAEVSDGAYPALDLEREELNLRHALKGVAEIDVSFLRPGTLGQLEEGIAGGLQVFHFSGHGELVEEMAERPGRREGRGRLILAAAGGGPEPFDADQLAQNLLGKGVRLVVLNACEGATRDRVNAWSGVAPALVRRGIPAVVGMQYSIRDDDAVAFGRRFYDALAKGLSIDTAVAEGRLAIFSRGGAAERDWGVPVLYLSSGPSILFPPPPGPLRLNLALLVSILTLLSAWFSLHVYPLAAERLSRATLAVGLGAGALAGLVAFWRLLASLVRTVTHTEHGPLVERELGRRRTAWVMTPVLALVLLLCGFTRSIYLADERSDGEAVAVALDTADGRPLSPYPVLTVNPERPLAGGPLFFRFFDGPLRARVTAPAGWEPRRSALAPRPWKRIDLRFPRDFTESRLVLLRLAADSALCSLLAPPSATGPLTPFTLRATLNDGETSFELSDLRQGLVYLGASEATLRARVREEDREDAKAALEKCVGHPGGGRDAMMQIWTSGTQLLPTDELDEDDTLTLEVLEARSGAVRSRKQVRVGELSARSINTLCLRAQ